MPRLECSNCGGWFAINTSTGERGTCKCIDIRDANVYIHSDVKQFVKYNRTSYSEVLYIVASFPNGKRLQHFKPWESNEIKEVKRIVGLIKHKGIINSDHWSETYPEYGSEYYQKEWA